jgi:hypothetical protein
MLPLLQAFLLALLATCAAEIAPRGRRRGGPPRPSVAIGALLTLTVMALVAPAGDPASAGPSGRLGWIVLGGIVLMVAGSQTDFGRPSLRRHMMATLAAGLLAAAGGFGFRHLGLPGGGALGLHLVASVVLTLALVFLVVSMVELCSLVPLLVGLTSFAAGGLGLLPVRYWESYAGMVLFGTLMGTSLGRLAGQLLAIRSTPHAKADVLVVGYLIAAAVLAAFLKSLTMAAFVLPVGFLATVVVLLGLQGFDRGILLRASPRG